MARSAVVQVLSGIVALYGIVVAGLAPATNAYKREIKSKEDNAKFLVEALNYEAENGKIKDVVRKIPVKPGCNILAIYQIKSGKNLNFVTVFENGDIKMESAENTHSELYTSPEALNSLYATFRSNFNDHIKGVEKAHLDLKDLTEAAKSVAKFPETIRKIGK